MDLLYFFGFLLAVPYLVAVGRARRIIEHIPRRCRDIPPRQGSRPCVWVHGVSVGEILSTRHFLRRFSEEFPEWEVILSSTTQAGVEAGSRNFPDKRVISYPIDFSYFVRRAFDRIRPDAVIIVEHELWPNFLWHAQARNVPVVIVNGRMSERSLKGYRKLSRFVTWPPPGIMTLCVENEVSAEGFRKLGVAPERIHVTGNFKFDNIPESPPCVKEELGLNGSDWVLLAASTHDGEEAMVADSFDLIHREDSRSRLIIAPRRVERVHEISSLLESRGLKVIRWTEYSRRKKDASNVSTPRADDAWSSNGHRTVLLIDTIGELDKISAAADVVFVGGSLVPFGGHNVIAPAGIGKTVVIGPHYHNFSSVVSAFLDRDAVIVARDASDLAAKLRELKSDPARAQCIARRASETIRECAGASERTLEVLRPLFRSLKGDRPS